MSPNSETENVTSVSRRYTIMDTIQNGFADTLLSPILTSEDLSTAKADDHGEAVARDSGVGGAPTAAPEPAMVPERWALHRPSPNPTSGAVTLDLDVPQGGAGHVALFVYDVRGRKVATLQDGWLAEGQHRRVWDGVNREGGRVALGMYFARVEGSGFAATQKILLLR